MAVVSIGFESQFLGLTRLFYYLVQWPFLSVLPLGGKIRIIPPLPIELARSKPAASAAADTIPRCSRISRNLALLLAYLYTIGVGRGSLFLTNMLKHPPFL